MRHSGQAFLAGAALAFAAVQAGSAKEEQAVDAAEMVVHAREPLNDTQDVDDQPTLAGAWWTRQGEGPADLSIRGSAFSEAGLTIGGIPLTNPQTEHFHGELPLPTDWFSAPRISVGFDQAGSGGTFAVGAIAMDPGDPEPRRGVAEISADDVGGHAWRLGLGALWNGGAASASADVSRHDLEDVDRQDNDMRAERISMRATLPLLGGVVDVMAGRREREFGTRGFYGVTPVWDSDEQLRDTLVFAQWRPKASDTYLSVLWRDLEDDYRLFWDRPGIYINQHKTNLRGAAASWTGDAASTLRLPFRVEALGESIRSSALGDHNRARVTGSALPEWQHGAMTFSGGIAATAFEEGEPAWLPQARIEWQLPRGILAASSTGTEREPSYTELNYESPGSLGNSGLKRQTCRSLDLVYRTQLSAGLEATIGTFGRETRHAVDWVRETQDSARWTATDLGTVQTLGIEATCVSVLGHLSLSAAYQWLQREFENEFFAGRYVMDYPEHALRLAPGWRAEAGWMVELNQEIRQYTENPLRSGSRVGFPAELAASLPPSATRNFGLRLSILNLWDDRFQELPDQDTQLRRRLKVTVSRAW